MRRLPTGCTLMAGMTAYYLSAKCQNFGRHLGMFSSSLPATSRGRAKVTHHLQVTGPHLCQSKGLAQGPSGRLVAKHSLNPESQQESPKERSQACLGLGSGDAYA